MPRRIFFTWKLVASHRLAARLVLATRASVPIHGRSIPATGGRSTALSMAGTSPAATGRTAVTAGFSAHGPVSGSAQRPFTASASSPAAASRSARSVPPALLTVTVLTWPVRATPARIVEAGRFQERSTSSMASSPTWSTAWVEISCTRASVHPPNQPSMVRYAVRAPWPSADISTDCTRLRRGWSLRAGALNCLTADDVPAGSANLVDWQGITIPVLEPEPTSRHWPGIRSTTWSRLTRSSSAIATGAAAVVASGSAAGACVGPGPSCTAATPEARALSRDGLTPWASVTAAPPSTTAVTTATAPAAVCVRRRAVPARRTIVTRGHRASSTWTSSGSKSGRIPVVGTSRAIENCDVAVCSRASTSCSGSPTSRAMSASGMSVRFVSSSTLRCTNGSLASPSRVARMSGSSLRSRWKMRAECRRCACRQASGRTQASGSSSRETLRQWCQAATNASRTALREAGRSPVRANVCCRRRVRVDL